MTYDVDLERISFKGSLDSLHHYADAIYATHRKPRKQAQLFDALLRTIASDLVPLRPERSEPRARKRRPKNYQLLTKPRKEIAPRHPLDATLRRARALKSIGNADAGLSAVEISSVSRDKQCVVETCGGPDDGIGKFEFVFLAEHDGFTSNSFVKLDYRKLPEKIFPDSS